MDDRSFDQLARALGGAASRRGALAALAGLGGSLGLAGHDADAKRKRRKKCDPPCPAGQRCRAGICACDDGGTVCGASCCRVGQRCEGGTCVEMPEPEECIAFGQPCKRPALPCCGGLQCGSGQGGKTDVACYRPAGAACASTAECIYGNVCTGGACVPIPQPTPTPMPTPAPAPRCTIAVTGDPDADGEALRALAEDPDGPSTITLCAGVYRARQEILIERDLTIQAVDDPGGEVILDGGWSGGEQDTDGHRVINVAGPDVRLTGVTVRNGYDGTSGGCLLSERGPTLLTLSQVTVTRCKSVFGGGISFGNFGNDGRSYALVIYDSEISGNTASEGGGLYAGYSTVTLAGATMVSDNIAAVGYGGGFLAAHATVALSGSVHVSGNEARLRGGGFYADASTVALDRDTQISDNEVSAALGGGGGFYANYSTVTLAGSTHVTGNSASSGAGFYAGSSTVTLGGFTEVSGNTASVAGGGFFATSSSVAFRGDSGQVRVTGNSDGGSGSGFVKDAASIITCTGFLERKVCANPQSGGAGCDGTVDASCASPQLCSASC